MVWHRGITSPAGHLRRQCLSGMRRPGKSLLSSFSLIIRIELRYEFSKPTPRYLRLNYDFHTFTVKLRFPYIYSKVTIFIHLQQSYSFHTFTAKLRFPAIYNKITMSDIYRKKITISIQLQQSYDSHTFTAKLRFPNIYSKVTISRHLQQSYSSYDLLSGASSSSLNSAISGEEMLLFSSAMWLLGSIAMISLLFDAMTSAGTRQEIMKSFSVD